MQQSERRDLAARIVLVACLIAATAWVAQARSRTAPEPTQPEAASPIRESGARIEVVFALDTTGSMSGLIEGAKRKIWSIASALADGKPTPEIRMGLLAYRDRGDAYVTERMDLTGDIDQVYAKLQSLRADGGGDGPESVNQALAEAVERMSWSDAPDVYRVIFLVGDAPPHMDYPDDTPYHASLGQARQKGIVVNTVQCGSESATERVWTEIASLGAGRFVAIRQDGGMLARTTPMDAELARLNADLGDTVLAWGAPESKDEIARKVARATAAEPEVAASRLAYLAKSGAGVVSGGGDLVDAVRQGNVDLAAVPPAELPDEMSEMDAGERRRYVAEKLDRRAEIQGRIDALTRDRDAYLRAQARASADAPDAFDAEVFEVIREQSAASGIRYE